MDGITDGVVVALIGLAGTVLAVAITVAGAALVASRQLRHDRAERATDRALQSKRDRLVTSMSAAADVTRSISALARPTNKVDETSVRFNDAVNSMAAAGTVASLDVVKLGRDLTGHAARLFMVGMAKRRRLEEDGSFEDWITFSDWTIEAQVELQKPYARLLAAVRRDLNIADSSDEQVLAATSVDVQALHKASGEAWSILNQDRRKSD